MATGLGQQRTTRGNPRTSPLSQHILNGVTDTGRVIGHGGYAVVKELNYRGLKCVGKKMHDILYDNATPQERQELLRRFEEECELLSRLHHPCIVQFMGVFFQDTPLPVLVMEYLHSTLAAAIDRYGVLPETICYGILCDVVLGVRYLHESLPSIIHRDLSANNVLLTPNMSAKISDLGVAKILNLTPAQITQMVQTKAPGTPCYMPPEALVSRPRYNTKIDIYSLGVMMIHVFCGKWPFPSDAFQPDPRNPDSFLPVTEVERRAEYLRMIGDDHPLMPLIRRCLSNNSTLRPDAAQIHTQVTEVQANLPATAETRVDFVRQLQSSQDETVAVRESLGEQVATLKRRLEGVSIQPSLPLRPSVAESAKVPDKEVHLLHPQAKLQWKRCADMPIKTFSMQAVVMGDNVYTGGGATDEEAVLVYNIDKDEWGRLSNHCLAGFALCQFQGKLITVGGVAGVGVATNKAYCYNEETQKWEEFLTPMPTARYGLSVQTTAAAIVACGGRIITGNDNHVPVATVEVYSSQTSQWYTADPLPQPCWMISSVTIGGTVFLLGGFDVNDHAIRSPFHADIALLIERAISPIQHPTTTSVWKTLPDTPLMGSAATTLNGSLLAVGGVDDNHTVQPSVHVFKPFTNMWVRVQSGDLPAVRCWATAVQLPDNRVMVVGGQDKDGNQTSTNFIGSLAI